MRRVSTDNGTTFGPMQVLATNGTIDEAAEEEQEEKSEKLIKKQQIKLDFGWLVSSKKIQSG